MDELKRAKQYWLDNPDSQARDVMKAIPCSISTATQARRDVVFLGGVKPKVQEIKRFDKFSDDTLLRMRKEGLTFAVIGKVLQRHSGVCNKRFKILTQKHEIQKQAEHEAVLEGEKYKKLKEMELYVIDSREPKWLIAMKGREYEDNSYAVHEYDVNPMAIAQATQRHNNAYGF